MKPAGPDGEAGPKPGPLTIASLRETTMNVTIQRPSTVHASAFCQADACVEIDTACAEPVRLHRPVRLRHEGLPAATSFWRWLLGETSSALPAVHVAARQRRAA